MWHPLLLLRNRRRADADFAEEIAAHLALEADRLVSEGMPPDAARLEARRRFGNVGRAQEAFHERRVIRRLESAAREARHAGRRLRRAPVFAVTVVLTLALGLAAATAVFGLVDAVLIRPLPFARPAELVDLSHTLAVQGATNVDQSDATYLYYQRANHVFSGMGAYRTASVNLDARGAGDAAHAERFEAARTTASVFPVLGVAPLRGRALRAGDDQPGSAPVVVLSQGLWERQYASDPAIIGRSIRVDGVPHTVIGVMPARFRFPDDRTALWLPSGIDPARTESATFDFRAVARLRDGVTPAAAAADLDRLLPHVPEAFPGRLTAGAIALTHMRTVVRPLRDVIVGEVGRALWVVLGAAGFLLLTVCANVANLFLVRAEERQQDLGMRRALGAGRGAIAGEFLAEGLLLAVLGGVLGLALAAAAIGVLRSLGSAIDIPRLADTGVNGTVLGAAAGVTLLAALLMCVVPAVRADGLASTAFLRVGRGATAGRQRHRTRRALVVAQVALALVLVAGAGLMARSFRRLRAVPLGFDASRAYTLRAALPEAEYPAMGSAAELILQDVERVAALPGVRAAGVISKLPLDAEGRRDTAVFLADRPLAMGRMPNVHQVAYATPGAFAALGIPLLQGRTFSRPDPARAQLEAVVTHALAARYWGDSVAVGRRLRLSPAGPWFTIVGVTGDVHGTRLDRPVDETVYLPLVTAPGAAATDSAGRTPLWMPRDLAFVARSADPAAVAQPVARALHVAAPGMPLYAARPMTEIVERSTARTSFTLLLLGIASGAALLIGAVGLYGAVSYMTSLRAREMAVRIALGAQPPALERMVLRQGVAVALAGVVLGLGVTMLATRVLATLLYGVAPKDPLTLALATVVMIAVAVAASWLPARRAAAHDPAAVLRADA